MRKPCCEKEDGFVNKGAWSKQEDQKLVDYITAHGEGCWRSLPKAAGLRRCGKSCRLRWINYLRPDIKRGNFAQDEEDLIIKLHALLGNRWSLIAGRLPGRTDNEVKNYWNSHIRKKLARMGIDPNNHKLQLRQLPPLTSHTSQITDSSGGSMHEGASKRSDCNDEKNSSNKNDSSNNNNNDNNNNKLCRSDMVVSSVDHDETSSPPLDLNLDLTIATPTSPSKRENLEGMEGNDSSKAVQIGLEDESQPHPTLVLFR